MRKPVLPEWAYPYREFSELAGPFTGPSADRHVQYQPLLGRARRLRAHALVALALLFETAFLVWLLLPSHYPVDDDTWQYWVSISMVASVGLVEGLRLLNVGTLALATLNARDPIPVPPEPGTRVAFLTTLVPGNEPLEMAERTLRAATRVRHDGPYDVWLLDEGNDPDVKAMCAARRTPLHPRGTAGVQPAQRHVQGEDQAGQLQRLARQPRRRLRLLAQRRHRPRPAPELRRASARLLPRP